MINETILEKKDADGITWITLNRPEVHNAFDERMIEAFREKLQILSADDLCRAVVIRGAGKSFCAGADLGWMRRAADFSHDQNLADAENMAWMFDALYRLNKLTIACITGVAIGGGIGIASCCDIVIADENATFALPEVKIGLTPSTIAPYILSAMGTRNARRYVQTGESFKAQRAHDLGLVHEITHNPAEMDAVLKTILDHVRANGPYAVGQAKQLVLDYGDQLIDAIMIEDTAERITAIRAMPEAKEGLTAFLEKRKPHWAENSNKSEGN